MHPTMLNDVKPTCWLVLNSSLEYYACESMPFMSKALHRQSVRHYSSRSDVGTRRVLSTLTKLWRLCKNTHVFLTRNKAFAKRLKDGLGILCEVVRSTAKLARVIFIDESQVNHINTLCSHQLCQVVNKFGRIR